MKTSIALAVLLSALLLLLTACASGSPLSKPTPGPVIPPLPTQARQTDSPTQSANALTDIERWLQLLTDRSSPAEPARPLTTH